LVKETKSKKELAMMVADAVEAAVGNARVMPPFIGERLGVPRDLTAAR